MATSRGGSPWADLPEGILESIGSRIDHPIDVLNFRSTCYFWRSAVPSPDFDHLIPPVEVRLPYPYDVDGVLAPSTMCFVEFQPPSFPNCNLTFAGGGWLIKIEESSSGKLQLLDPISNLKLRYSPTQLSCSAAFRAVPSSSSFRLRYQDGFPAFEVNKVVIFPPSATLPPQKQSTVTVIAIFHKGRVGYWRTGDENWTPLDDRNFDYDDIIPHRGQFHIVDRFGKLSVINSSLKFVKSDSQPQLPDGGGQKKNLVESGGDLYLVDRYLDGRRRNWKDVEDAITSSFHPIRCLGKGGKWNPRAVDFKVYKLDVEIGEWVEVNSLGGEDTVFVLTPECCFSAPAAHIAGGERDCIYYSDDDADVAGDMLSTESIRVFRMEDRRIQKVRSFPGDSDVFQPLSDLS